MRRSLFAMAGLLLLCSPLLADDPAPGGKSAPVPSRAELEKKFAEEMSGATLVGHFTAGDNSPQKPERYTLTEVSKLRDDYWVFKTRIVYGDHDLTLPLTLEVKWAADTPVITLTDLAIPGLGTFTARVMIFQGQYAGMWSGADHGGQLFGRVEKKGPTAQPAQK